MAAEEENTEFPLNRAILAYLVPWRHHEDVPPPPAHTTPVGG